MKTIDHVIISGGCSGLGLGLATRYLKAGYSVSLLDIQEASRSNADALNQAAGSQKQWAFFETDITDLARTEKAVAQAIRAFDRPILAINSAGIGMNKSFDDTTSDAFQRVMGINLLGSFHFAKAVLPHMRQKGRLAFIASLAGLVSNYGYSAYGTSKFGVVGLATTLRYEFEPKGLDITCVCPPEVKTPMVEKERADGNPVSLALKDIAGSMDADDACDQIFAGINAGKWMVIPSSNAKVTAWAARYLPGTFYRFMHRQIKKALFEYQGSGV